MSSMKTALLFLFILGICSVSSVEACPIYQLANIKVIDQHGQPINNAKVYHYSSLQDSFPLRRREFWLRQSDGSKLHIDSNIFALFSSGGWGYYLEDTEPSTKEFLITAPGYANVAIKSADFRSKENTRNLPILEVVLYAKKLVRTNNDFQVYESFYLQDEVKVEDSLRLELKDYLKDIRTNEQSIPEAEASVVSVKAYPNPVQNELHIRLAFTPTAAHKIVLHDAQGKRLYEAITETAEHELVMSWYVPGTYYLTVYDPSDTPLLRQQVVKE